MYVSCMVEKHKRRHKIEDASRSRERRMEKNTWEMVEEKEGYGNGNGGCK